VPDEELEEARDDAYVMGKADGKGDLPDEISEFLNDLINDESFRNLPSDLKKRAKRLAQQDPNDFA
jgi:hypothetical protein